MAVWMKSDWNNHLEKQIDSVAWLVNELAVYIYCCTHNQIFQKHMEPKQTIKPFWFLFAIFINYNKRLNGKG